MTPVNFLGWNYLMKKLFLLVPQPFLHFTVTFCQVNPRTCWFGCQAFIRSFNLNVFVFVSWFRFHSFIFLCFLLCRFAHSLDSSISFSSLLLFTYKITSIIICNFIVCTSLNRTSVPQYIHGHIKSFLNCFFYLVFHIFFCAGDIKILSISHLFGGLVIYSVQKLPVV